MRGLARCVGLLCLLKGIMAVKVKVTVQEIVEDQVSTSRQGRQLSFDVKLDERVIPVFVASVGTALLQNMIDRISASGQYIFLQAILAVPTVSLSRMYWY